MKSELFSWHKEWGRDSDLSDASLVIYFAAPTVIRGHNVSDILRKRYPLARQIGCSSGGEIHDAGVIEESISGVALSFDRAEFKIVSTSVNLGEDHHSSLQQQDWCSLAR
ncbi:FIST N-terminal domain-containing protein [Zhongshania sp.]|uniref:FIST N-terminal domain-containing protein n=1 Tax=Zhongshania sp. TaxID=1971902 RepID=UPI00356316B5